jgi:predicted transcriptional regulator
MPGDLLVQEILEKWRRGTRGPLPQLTPLKILQAVVVIDQEGPVGRRILAQALGINDGVARGLLERLSDEGLASVDENGASLSQKGKTRLSELLQDLSVKKIQPLDQVELVPGRMAVAIHLANAYRIGMTGILQRDEAVRAGAEGSITFGVREGKLIVPPDGKDAAELSPVDDSRLRQTFSLLENDMIVIGFAKDRYRALAGSLAAVFSLSLKP